MLNGRTLLFAAALAVVLTGIAVALTFPPRMTTELVSPGEPVTVTPPPDIVAMYNECVQRFGANSSVCLAASPKPYTRVFGVGEEYETHVQQVTAKRAVAVGIAFVLALGIAAFAVSSPSEADKRHR